MSLEAGAGAPRSDPEWVPPGLEDALTEHVFSTWDQQFLQTPEGQQGKRDVILGRHQQALRYVVPWLARVAPLAGLRVVEIGCGSGSSTVALAQHCREVLAYDIDAGAVRAAIARCEAYGVTNVVARAVAPQSLIQVVREHHAQADAFVLYAVLEHQLYDERLETLETLWDLLAPGGVLAVVETPNRLTWVDTHTAQMPFFHLLPDALAFRYLPAVPRHGFRDHMTKVLSEHPEHAAEQRIRWGIGASFHEFEIALREPLTELLVADGFEPEMLQWFPPGDDEQLLTQFFCKHVPDEPLGFARAVLALVLRKPRGPADRAAAARFCEARRQELCQRMALAAAPPPPAPREPSLREIWRDARRWLSRRVRGT